MAKDPVRVLVTGAAGIPFITIFYNLYCSFTLDSSIMLSSYCLDFLC
jgi:hypothetical protein